MSTTYTSQILTDISKFLPYLKLIEKSSHSSGTVSLFRNTIDGNAYEIDVRPASLAQHKDIWGDLLVKKIQRKNFNPNKNEPLSLHDVTAIIKNAFSGLINRIVLKRNNKTEFLFKIELQPDISTTNQINEAIHAIRGFDYFSIEDIQLANPDGAYLIIRYNKIV